LKVLSNTNFDQQSRKVGLGGIYIAAIQILAVSCAIHYLELIAEMRVTSSHFQEDLGLKVGSEKVGEGT
jgi:hypothetical protein